MLMRYCRSSAGPAKALLAVMLVAISACRHDRGATEKTSALSAGMSLVGYPMGRWRLAPFNEVNRTVLWVSHILVMSEASIPGDPSFRPLEWRPDPPMPKRTDAEALARGLKVADLAAEDPSKFGELARTYSDDVITRDAGGSLGGARAGQLPSEYRDALATLKPGETSRVVRTALGYSILLRRDVPPAGDVGGQRIVIRYRGTVGGARGEPSHRSRAEALELARAVAAEAAVGSRPFETLVARYSENADAAQAGDMGVWSLRDPGFLPREIERLGQLRIGEVAGPIESIVGFEILKRTEANERPQYAMKAVQFQYDPALADSSERSREGALRLATDTAAELQKDPSRFDSLRAKYCCDDPSRWSLGRGPLGLSSALDGLQLGQIAIKPIESNLAFVVPQRVDPASVAPLPAPLYELPAPDAPDLADIVEKTDGTIVSGYARLLAGEIPKAISLPQEKAALVGRRVADLADAFQRAPNGRARADALQGTLAGLRNELGPGAFSVLDDFLKQWSTRLYLQRMRPMPLPHMPARKPT
jgi:parvulin-like peptidyl-prolyl isomerase